MRRFGWRGVVGILLSVAILAWALREVSPGEVWEVLRHSRWGFFVLSAIVATLAFPLRAWRWRYLLLSVAVDVPYGALWRSTAIGFMVNNVALARAGELARAYALTREDKRVRFTAALGSLVVDRVLDAVAILVLLIAAIAVPSFPKGTVVGGRPVQDWAILTAVVATVALLGLTALAVYPRAMLGIWDALVGRVAPRWSERGRRLLEGFATGLGVLRNPRLFVLVMAWTLGQWILNGASFWIAFHAVDITPSFSAALFTQSLLALSVAAPSTPGFFGVFEGVALAALSVYGVPNAQALSYAIGYHITSYIPITVIGLAYFMRLGLHFRDLGTGATNAAAGGALSDGSPAATSGAATEVDEDESPVEPR